MPNMSSGIWWDSVLRFGTTESSNLSAAQQPISTLRPDEEGGWGKSTLRCLDVCCSKGCPKPSHVNPCLRNTMVQIHPFSSRPQPQTYGRCCMQQNDSSVLGIQIHIAPGILRQRSQMRLTNAFSIDFSFHHIQLHLCFWYCQGQIPHLDRRYLSKVDGQLPGKNVKKSSQNERLEVGSSILVAKICWKPARLCPTFAHFNAGFRPCDRHPQQGHAILPCDAFTRIVVVDVGHCQFFGLETHTHLLLRAASFHIFPAPESLKVPAYLEVDPKTTSIRSLKSLIHTYCNLRGHLLSSQCLRLSRTQLLGTQICWHCQFSTTSAGCHVIRYPITPQHVHVTLDLSSHFPSPQVPLAP